MSVIHSSVFYTLDLDVSESLSETLTPVTCLFLSRIDSLCLETL